MAAASVLETQRLVLRKLALQDAPFIVELLNEPSFLRYIGDKGVRTTADACRYLNEGPLDSYLRHGFGLYLVELRESGTPIGMCGLLKRDTLKDVDVGFAFLPRFWAQGYGYESAAAVLAHGRAAHGLRRIVAITNPDNLGSIQLLSKLGFRSEGLLRLTPESPEICLFASDVAPPAGLVELIAELEHMPEELERAIGQVSADRLAWKPESFEGSPGETFSALEHVCHLRDIEIDGYQLRIKRLLEEQHPSLASLDGYELAAERRYAEADLQGALSSFRQARRATVASLRGLSEQQLGRTGVFAEYGPLTLRALLHYLRSHDQQHLACVHWLIGKMASV